MTSRITWLIPEKLARGGIPGHSDLEMWREAGIDSVVNLLEQWHHGIAQEEREAGFNVLHSPIPDFDAPTVKQLHRIVQWIDNEISAGKKVLVHCFAGIGRTGTVLISYLLYKGKTQMGAEAEVRGAGAAAQSSEQQAVIQKYYSYLGEKL